ncbi:fumarylacetoacetate hydrolase family protein [Nonomuraea soli]|uniref:2-keto-4-pentenoate hydratase/2-oxohepta-3-ene-1,7-dioic acid hydratase in catechol pathway n=1 Tax=Nonomuraea soli TaxID=1032476 RepID=A0A7W0CSN9_9ACTN|nr:fumarylacetoacetate hydrolase family protein [Nonomuraea soli]MBA2896493.1 2-keto-4-pentenoate hydratase/2-oxohepta-3-ene-1,7-dioic acid hydratase in catechol pathway [Nonomuraea soli]
MRVANLAGRAVLITGAGAIDIEKASGGGLPADPQALFERWADLGELDGPAVPYAEEDLLAPSPAPRQVFAIGVNYRDHAEESNIEPGARPPVFTKFVSCLTGQDAVVTLPAHGLTDWEVELVVVIGRRAHRVSAAEAWSHVAGLTVGQDLSERITQLSPPQPHQFSLGKSFPGFGPTGPWLVTPDEFADPGDLEIGCELDGERMQHARTSQMIFNVPQLVEYLSGVTPLLPGDVIFTGTPGGIGGTRTPARFLAPGEQLHSTIEGIGTLRTTFTSEGA